MMVPEQIPDARHEAIVCLHRALIEVEAGDAHAALNACHSAIAWLRDMPGRLSEGSGVRLNSEVESSKALG